MGLGTQGLWGRGQEAHEESVLGEGPEKGETNSKGGVLCDGRRRVTQ